MTSASVGTVAETPPGYTNERKDVVWFDKGKSGSEWKTIGQTLSRVPEYDGVAAPLDGGYVDVYEEGTEMYATILAHLNEAPRVIRGDAYSDTSARHGRRDRH